MILYTQDVLIFTYPLHMPPPRIIFITLLSNEHGEPFIPFPTKIAKLMEPTWGPPGFCWPQMGPMLDPWTLLPGYTSTQMYIYMFYCILVAGDYHSTHPHIRWVPMFAGSFGLSPVNHRILVAGVNEIRRNLYLINVYTPANFPTFLYNMLNIGTINCRDRIK